VPSSPSSPLPLRNSILALFAAIFLGVLVALGRDQLVPRVDSSRDLSRLIEVPVLVEVPNVRPGLGRRTALLTAAENESYQSLRASLEMALPPTEQRTVLVSSAVHAEGKTTVTARLGRALVEAGHSTLLVSADLRRPELHNHFDLPPGAGVEEILSVLHQSAGRADPTFRRALVAAIAEVPLKGRGRPRPGKLGLLRSGTTVPDPARLLSPETMSGFVEELQRLDYQYVLFDGPPLLGIADSQVMSQEVDHLLIVSRLDALTLGSANDLRDALSLTGSRPLGLVVIGGRFEMSPYYLHSAPAPAAGARSG
jgi:Mrp family chromosome partitioning ATPase